MKTATKNQDIALSPARASRSEFGKLVPDINFALLSLGREIRASGLEPVLIELVQLRASQINGCSFCVQFHLAGLRHRTAPQSKLDMLSAWRDACVFSERERAALAWAEALTDLGRDGVSDAIYAHVSKQFSKNELAILAAAVAAISAWNRISIAFRFPPPSEAELSAVFKK